MKLEKIISSKILDKLSDSDKKSLSESITKHVNSKTETIEKELSSKFESIVDDMDVKFNTMLNEAVESGVTNNIQSGVNKQLFTALESIVNILEGAGIYVSEETKRQKVELIEKNKQLRKMTDSRNELLDKYKKSTARDYIMSQLMGSEPKIIQAALDHFDGKDIETVVDELDDFINGDFSNIDLDEDYTEGLDGLDLDELESSLGQINDSNMFESINSKDAIKVSGGKHMASITEDMLNKPILDSNNNTELDDDTEAAMEAIDNMKSLGYGINPLI
jgi:hypothetical protein